MSNIFKESEDGGKGGKDGEVFVFKDDGGEILEMSKNNKEKILEVLKNNKKTLKYSEINTRSIWK